MGERYAGATPSRSVPAHLPCFVLARVSCCRAAAADITGTTTKATPLSIFSHPYFNLAGFADNATVLDHLLTIHEG